MSFEKLSDAVDLSHHLSKVARARSVSPLKGLQKYLNKAGIINLAGGLPHPDYFPFASVGGEALLPSSFSITSSEESSSLSWLWNLFSSKEKGIPIQIPKYPVTRDVNLAQCLQYGLATGLPILQRFIKDFTDKVYQPNYANFATLVHIGNTDGWGKVALTLCNPGEGVLVDEWTYPSAMSMMSPFNIQPVAVPLDGQGVVPDAMRRLLSEWDENVRGMPRPHVFYTIPVGQNPTGSTTFSARKQEIYEVCVDFDIIIVEDDPYYFLQQATYLLPSERTETYYSVPEDDDQFLSQLAPTYLKLDRQGRVIRLDTFSKTIAPGARLGWFTCNQLFAERLERQSETTTQAPCGFSQAIVAKLLEEWQFTGYLRWLKGLRIQYQQRRDFFIDCIHDQFDVQLSSTDASVSRPYQGLPVYIASLRRPKILSSEKRTHSPVFSFTPPSAGMFIWIKVFFEDCPSFTTFTSETLEMKLWVALAGAGLLVAPGYMFAGDSEASEATKGHFRISFSNAEFKDIKKAVLILSSVMTSFYTLA